MTNINTSENINMQNVDTLEEQCMFSVCVQVSSKR